MSCVNINSPEFQEILKTEPNLLLAELIYDKKMAEQKTKLYDDVREFKSETSKKTKPELGGVTEEWEFKNVKSLMRLTDAELKPLIDNKNYKITNPVELEKFNKLAEAVGEKEAYRDYFEHNEVVRPASAVIEKINERIEKEDFDPINSIDESGTEESFGLDDFIQRFDSIVQVENENRSIDVAEQMSKQLGIPYEIITQEEMSELFPGQPYRKNFYQAGKVYLVRGSINAGSVFHEFSHPVIKAMNAKNPTLFKSLFDELASTELGQQILNDVTADPQYENNSPEFMEEAIVRSLEAINAGDVKAPESFIKNLFFQIKQFLRKMLGKKIEISKLNSKTTLAEIVKMINYGEEFNLDVEFLQKDLMVMFKTDYDQLKSQIKDGSAVYTQNLMNQVYSLVKTQLAGFKAENDIFKKIESQLADENREGVLNQMQQILEGLVTIGSNKLVNPLDTLKITGNQALDKDILEFNSKINSFVKVMGIADQMFDIFSQKIDDLKNSGVKTTDEFDQLFAIMQYNEDWLNKINNWIVEFTRDNPNFDGTTAFDIYGVDEKGNPTNPLATALAELADKVSKNKTKADAVQAEAVIDVLYEHLNEQLAPIKKDFLEQLATTKAAGMIDQYNRLHEEYYGVNAEEMAELNRLKNKNYSELTVDEKQKLETLKFKTFDSHVVTKESLKARAEGKLGDASKWNGLMDSHMANQDSIVGGFYTYLMKTFNTISGNANARRADMLDGLQPLLKAAGYDTTWLGEGKLGKEIGQINRSSKIGADGKVQEFLEYRFMSNFVNYDFDLQNLNQNVVDARKEYNNNPNPKSKEAFTKARRELEQFKQDFMHRDYVQKYYEIKSRYFFNDAGEKAQDMLEDIFNRMEIFAENVNIDPTNFGSVQALDDLWEEYQRLHSIYDIYGNEKPDAEKEIAEILTGYREEMSEFYEWEEREDAFENALERFNETLLAKGILPGSAAHTEEMRKWIEHNTTISVKEEYYQIREDMMETRSALVKPIQDMNNSLIDVAPLFKTVSSILKPTKDNFNQYDGTKLTPEAQIKIKDTQQTISNIKDQWIQLYGGTKEELRKYRRIEEFQANNNGEFETIEDSEYYYNFWDEMSDRLMLDFELTKDDIAYIRDLDKTLSSMSTSGLTKYYVTSFLNFMTTNQESYDLINEAFGFVDFKAGDVPAATHVFEVISKISFTNKLSAINPEFKAWFERNHYVQTVNEYDVNTGQFIDEIEVNRPTSAWQYTIPDDINYYEAKAVIGTNIPSEFAPKGYIELNGVPRIPTRAYYRRNVKEEFHTKQITEDYVNADGELVLANIDNRGQWLPRDYIPGDSESATSNKYIDAKYKDVFKNNNDLWKLSDHLKKAHLRNQEGLDKAQKLYLSYPRYRKGSVEGLSKGYFKRKVNRFFETFKPAVDDMELGLYTGNDVKKVGYTTLSRPLSGSYSLDINDVSTNIINSIMDHSYSIEHFKAMRKVNSFAHNFQNTMENFAREPYYSEIEKQLRDAAILTPAKKVEEQHRIKQIKSILDKHFKGISLAGDLTKREFVAAKVLTGLQRWMSFSSFALDPIKSLTNYYGGKSMLYKKSVEGDLYTAKDLALSRVKAGGVISELIAKQYSNMQVSARLQLIDVLGAIPGNLKKEIGSRGSKTVAQSVLGGNFVYFDRRYLSESVPVHQFLAILNKNSFMLDGKKTSLDDAIELVDGRLQTKAGVPKDMSISYDAKGDIVLGDKLKDIMNTHQSVLSKSLGINDEFTEAEAYRHLMGKLVFFLLKFFPGMLNDRYQIRTKKGKLGHRRINYATKRAEVGTYLGALKLIQELVSNKGKFWQYKNYSWQAKKGAMQLALAYLISMVLTMMSKNVGFDDDDDGLIDFFFDLDEDGIYKKLNKSTALPDLPLISEKRTASRSGRTFKPVNYLKLNLVRLILRVKREEETFMPFSAMGTIGGLLLLDSPLQDGGGFKTIKDVSSSLYATFIEDKPDVYKRAAGPFIHQEADKNKAYNYILKSIGLNGGLVDPAASIERENSGFFN